MASVATFMIHIASCINFGKIYELVILLKKKHFSPYMAKPPVCRRATNGKRKMFCLIFFCSKDQANDLWDGTYVESYLALKLSNIIWKGSLKSVNLPWVGKPPIFAHLLKAESAKPPIFWCLQLSAMVVRSMTSVSSFTLSLKSWIKVQ